MKSDVLAKATEYIYVGADAHSSPSRWTIQAKWLHAPLNWYKLN